MNKQELSAILESHAKWVAGMGGERANLAGANLYGANLYEANLAGANLTEAVGNNSRISCLQHGVYRLVVLDQMHVWGGCTYKTAGEWLAYTGGELSESDRDYLENITKPFIRMVCR